MSTPPMSERNVYNPIQDKIGRIFDPAFLKLLTEEQLHQITIATARGELAVSRAQTSALEDVVKTIESMKFQSGRVATKG